MKFDFIVAPSFYKEVKKLSKKYPSLGNDLVELKEELASNPRTGVALGDDCFKVRMAIHSKGKGKSGGARIVTCVKIVQSKIYLLTIFDKSEKENISDKELSELIKQIQII